MIHKYTIASFRQEIDRMKRTHYHPDSMEIIKRFEAVLDELEKASDEARREERRDSVKTEATGYLLARGYLP